MKCKITLGDVMKLKQDKRRFDFHDIGRAIKRAREASGMTQEQLAYIVDRSPRTIMYNENDGQHPSLNTFYQLVTMFDISVDQYFYPSKNSGSECRKRIDAMLGSLDERELKIVEATIQAMKAAKETEDA
jgi:transcriptional regulator, merR family